MWTKCQLHRKAFKKMWNFKGRQGVAPKVHIVLIEFFKDWKEAKVYKLTQFWPNVQTT